MKKITIHPHNTEELISQMQTLFGGEISERWGESTLNIDSDIAKGCIKFVTFDWGVSLIEYNLIFFEDVQIISHTGDFNPLYFVYCSKGSFKHRLSDTPEFTEVEEFHAAIIVTKRNVAHHTIFPKGIHLEINVIGVVRQDYLNKRINNVAQLNEKLSQVFLDKEEEMEFAYYSPIHVKMEEHVDALRNIDSKGMIRLLQMEGAVYQLLSMHIARHDRVECNENIPSTLLKKDLKIVKRYAEKILEEPSFNYSLDQLSKQSGLSQSKLQDGFKFFYMRTVTEYIRHVRLEAARDLMNSSDLNISQIVYSIGFTSRSYFSKIFKEKYGMTPNELKKKSLLTVE